MGVCRVKIWCLYLNIINVVAPKVELNPKKRKEKIKI